MEKKYTTFKDKQDAQEFIIGIVKKMNPNNQKEAAILMAGFALAKESDEQKKHS
ncbi:hypothetical protein [Thomasclavelia cocleata]|uniref:hypothetical protein n=1 Tax=Thomasclavelia cocleata TaxID=69824 RepID=UPI002431279A|nr:hypothetical protein [Thomasclavelia cocleata]